MRILIDIGHPAHVHFFKHAIWELEKRGHNLLVTSRKKDIATKLLDIYNIKHECLGIAGQGLLKLGKELLWRDAKLLKLAKSFSPDILLGIAGIFIAHVGRLLGSPSIFFTDTENARLINGLGFPFATTICTPSCFQYNVGAKQVVYNGYHELAYLHPNYFKPDASILKLFGVKDNEKFVIMRFVGWEASHDVGHKGLSLEMKIKAVKEFSKHAKVFITSEKELPVELKKYRIKIPIERIHDILYYATLLYGESATMASESAILGTPAIFLDDVGRGYTNEQERVYGSVFNFTGSLRDQQRSINKGIELVRTQGIKEMWKNKRQMLLNDKIDVTAWLVDLIENYPKV